MKSTLKKIIFLVLPFYSGMASAQITNLKVLFIGNSYTATNNLPMVTEQIARSMGDTLIYESNAPGGQTLEGHSKDGVTLGLIAKGDWNLIVLQEQSQRPAFPDAQVAVEFYPYGRFLDSLVHDKNICGRSIFYRTWGYPDGDADNCPVFPPICTYKGMDSLLSRRYTKIAKDNQALLSPVGDVFKEIMGSVPSVNLFAADRKHPSAAGTYAAALTFYTILYRKDPTAVTYTGGLSLADAKAIGAVVRNAVFLKLNTTWRVNIYDPRVLFSSAVAGSTVTFNSSASEYVIHYRWDFGDGNTSTVANPVHTYALPGTYKVTLYGDNCVVTDTLEATVITAGAGITEYGSSSFRLYPNPTADLLYLENTSGIPLHDAVLHVTDLSGREVMRMTGYNGGPLDISHLNAGVYLLRISSAQGPVINLKLVRQ
jgi:hypothetical protein